MDYRKYLVSREPKEVELNIEGEVLKIKIRALSWSLKNQYVSLNSFRDDSSKFHFDVDGYVRSCLKYMIVEAPWGETNDIFLLQLEESPLSQALETLVPGPWEAKAVNRDELKKDSRPSLQETEDPKT